MTRSFVSNLIFLLVINLLVKPFYVLAIDRVVQIRVGEASYGLYFALFNFAYLFYVLLDMGFTSFNNRTIAQNPKRLSELVPNFLIAKTALALLFLLVIFFFAWCFNYDAQSLWLLLPIGINVILIALNFYLRSNISGLQHFKIDSTLSMIDRLSMIFICGWLLWFSQIETFKIEHFIYAQTCSYGITSLLALGFLYRFGAFKKIRLDLKVVRTIIRDSLPYSLMLLLMALYFRVDGFMIERLLTDGKEQAGIYAAGFRILDMFTAFALLFAGLLLPMFARMLSENKGIQKLTKSSSKILLSIACITICPLLFHSDYVMTLLYPSATSYWVEVFEWLILSFLPIAVIFIFSTLLTANGNLRTMNIIALFGVVLNISLNLFLIPSLKAEGAAITTLLTQFIMALSYFVASHKQFAFQTDYRLIFKVGILAALAILINYGLSISSLPSEYQIIIGVIAVGFGAFVMRILSFKELWSYIILKAN